MLKVGINGFGRIRRIAFRIEALRYLEELEFLAKKTLPGLVTLCS